MLITQQAVPILQCNHHSNPRMLGWKPVRVWRARTSKQCANELTVRGCIIIIFFGSLHATARSTPVLCNCWYLRDSSNCVLLYFSSAGLNRSSFFSVGPLAVAVSLWKSFRDMATFTLLQTVQRKPGAAARDRAFSYRVHQNQLCENILAECRLTFSDDAGQGGLL